MTIMTRLVQTLFLLFTSAATLVHAQCNDGLQIDAENNCCANPVSVTLYLDRWGGSNWAPNHNGWDDFGGNDVATLYLLSQDDLEKRTIDGNDFQSGEYKTYKSSLCVVGAWWGPATGRFAESDLANYPSLQKVRFGEEYIRRTNVAGGSEGDIIFSNCNDPTKSFQKLDVNGESVYGCYCNLETHDELSDGSCVPKCGADETRDDTTEKCVCDDGKGFVADVDGNCVCDVDNNWVGGTKCAQVIVDGTTLKKGESWTNPEGVVDLSSFDTVTEIFYGMFQDATGITSVIFPPSLEVIGTRAFYRTGINGTLDLSNTDLTTIGRQAFYECTEITGTLDLSNTALTTIKQEAFYFVGVENIIFPTTLQFLESAAFKLSGLKTLKLAGTQVTTIPDRTLQSTAVSNITLPSILTSVGIYAFYTSTNVEVDFSLVEQDVNFDSQVFSSSERITVKVQKSTGVAILDGLPLPSNKRIITVDCDNGYESDGNGGCVCPSATHEELSDESCVPKCGADETRDDTTEKCVCDDGKGFVADVDGNCVCDVSNYWVGSTVCAPVRVEGTTLKKGSGWREPKGVVDLSSFDTRTKIHEYMFSNDKGITSVIFPDSLQVIDTRAFSECTGITGTLDLSNTALTTIKMEAFYKAGMENIIFPTTFTTLGNDAFSHSSLKTLDLNGTQVRTITKFSFHYANQLESVTFPSTLTSVQEYALYIDSNLVLDFSRVNQDVSFHSSAFNTPTITTVKVQKSTGVAILDGLPLPSNKRIITVDCDNGYESDGNGGCVCPSATHEELSDGSCVPKCGAGGTRDDTTGICVCDDLHELVGEVCACKKPLDVSGECSGCAATEYFDGTSCVSDRFRPNNLDKLKAAVNLCLTESSSGDCGILANTDVPSGQGAGKYGPIGSWDTSQVTDFSQLFDGKTHFNQDIGNWNTSGVTNMYKLFYNNDDFNQDIGAWDTSQVTDMSRIFYGAHAFNQDIGGWDVGRVTTTNRMFSYTYTFNHDIGGWDTSSVTDMQHMLSFNHEFNQDISSWNVGKVTNMDYMFYQTRAFNQDINRWDVRNVESFSRMFYATEAAHPTAFNKDLCYPAWVNRWVSDDGKREAVVTDMFKNNVRPNYVIGTETCCPENSIVSPDKLCVCPEGKGWDGAVCAECSAQNAQYNNVLSPAHSQGGVCAPMACPVGQGFSYNASVVGSNTQADAHCSECGPNSFSNNTDDGECQVVELRDCPAGHENTWTTSSNAVCTACPEGKSKNTTGRHACTSDGIADVDTYLAEKENQADIISALAECDACASSEGNGCECDDINSAFVSEIGECVEKSTLLASLYSNGCETA